MCSKSKVTNGLSSNDIAFIYWLKILFRYGEPLNQKCITVKYMKIRIIIQNNIPDVIERFVIVVPVFQVQM